MAEAIITGMIKAGYNRESILTYDTDQHKSENMKKKYGITNKSNSAELLIESDVIILAVKPQVLLKILQDISGNISKDKIVISIAAGIEIKKIKEQLATDKIIRVMPNTPALIEKGISALSIDDSSVLTNKEKELIESIFAAVGEYLWLEENQFNAVTAISGSGPAYVYRFIEAFIDSGVLIGLPRELAYKLVLETIIGSVYMVKENNEAPKSLEAKVTSPGGTTIYGLTAMEKSNFSNAIKDGVKAAYQRAEEIGNKY